MPGYTDGSTRTPSHPPNAFSPRFLQLFDEHDEPPTAAEADVAGPWSIAAIPGAGYGLFRAGEGPPRGVPPAAVFPDRWVALLAAAVLPGTGRELLFLLDSDPGPEGYAVRLEGGEVVGRLALFDEALVEALNGAVGLARSPMALAYLLEAAGAVALERCGAILQDRIAAGDPAAG